MAKNAIKKYLKKKYEKADFFSFPLKAHVYSKYKIFVFSQKKIFLD